MLDGNTTITVSLVLALIGSIITVVSFISSNKDKGSTDGEGMGRLKESLENTKRSLDEVRGTMNKISDSVIELDKDSAKFYHSIKSEMRAIEIRLDEALKLINDHIRNHDKSKGG